jgi:hypothetical protein
MIKKSLKSAIGVSIGVTIGGCVLPRIFFSNLHNDTWPPIWQQAVLYFVIGYVASFLVYLVINWIKSKK